MQRPIRRVLLVDDDVPLLRALRRAFTAWNAEIRECTCLSDAMDALDETIDLVVVDVRLPDGTGLSVAQAASQMNPTPLIIALSGSASATEAFRLAQAGVLAYLQKPISLRDLEDAIVRIQASPPSFGPLVAARVGASNLKQIQADVRRTALNQALGLAEGNRTNAARILNVTRQAVQHMMRTDSSRDTDGPDPTAK